MHKQPDEARDAARFILQSDNATSPAKHLASVVLGGPCRPTPPNQISDLVRQARAKTRALPGSPLPWVDLALGYTILGKTSDARRALLTAVQNAANSRYVLRSSAAFFAHTGDLDTAHDILCRSESIRSDPWLLASEAAVAAASHKRPSFVRTARSLVNQKYFSEKHVNELLAALGTIEFQSGSDRIARQLFRRALKDPSENVVAQARWVAKQGLAIEIPPYTLELPMGFETRAWNNRYLGNWRSSVENSKKWLNYQLFLSSPAILGSFVSAVALEDHSTAIQIINDGLKANPLNPILLNNLAYSAVCQGDFQKAEKALRSIAASGNQRIASYKTATTGLLKFRQGAVDLGRKLYSEAADKARHLADAQFNKRLMIFWALEEIRAGGSISGAIPTRAIDLAHSDKDPVVGLLVERVRSANLSRTEQN